MCCVRATHTQINKVHARCDAQTSIYNLCVCDVRRDDGRGHTQLRTARAMRRCDARCAMCEIMRITLATRRPHCFAHTRRAARFSEIRSDLLLKIEDCGCVRVCACVCSSSPCWSARSFCFGMNIIQQQRIDVETTTPQPAKHTHTHARTERYSCYTHFTTHFPKVATLAPSCACVEKIRSKQSRTQPPPPPPTTKSSDTHTHRHI